jgi:hypothetical protein
MIEQFAMSFIHSCFHSSNANKQENITPNEEKNQPIETDAKTTDHSELKRLHCGTTLRSIKCITGASH